MIKALWDKVDGSSLSQDELQSLAQGEELSYELGHLARTINGIACLVAEDGTKAAGAGNFQHHSDVTDLLFAIGDAIAIKAECVNIASYAAWMCGEKTAKGS
ncbi:MAG: hypothetical protein PHV02_12105 [Rhodocyclaceae bacterium]|nr:hypothetical protein [Rhodocyclaceae bacterium]